MALPLFETPHDQLRTSISPVPKALKSGVSTQAPVGERSMLRDELTGAAPAQAKLTSQRTPQSGPVCPARVRVNWPVSAPPVSILISLPAGQWADRYDRKRLALIGIAVLVLCAALFLAMTVALDQGGGAPARVVGSTRWSSPAAIYTVLAISGVSRAILQPARQALGTMIVPSSLYANAATWRSSIWQFASVLGPAIGGLIFAFAGPVPTYTVTFVLLVLALWGI